MSSSSTTSVGNRFTIGSSGTIDSSKTSLASGSNFTSSNHKTRALAKHTAAIDRSGFIGPLHKDVYQQAASEVTQNRIAHDSNRRTSGRMQSGAIPNTVFVNDSSSGQLSLSGSSGSSHVQAQAGLVMNTRMSSGTPNTGFETDNSGRIKNTISMDTSKGHHLSGSSHT